MTTPEDFTPTEPTAPDVPAQPPVRETIPTEARSAPASRAVPILIATNALLAVVAVLLALMVFAPGSAPIKLGSTRLAARARTEREISDVARRFANNFLRISYRSIDADADRIAKDTTSDFGKRIRRALDVGKDRLIEVRGVSSGRVSEVLVLSQTSDAATARVVATRTIRNRTTSGPRSIVVTIDLNLVHTVDGWKVANAAGESPSPTS